jgi:error-prone DNA polymerase
MTVEERLHADFRSTGVNIGKHPMAHHRTAMDALGVTRAFDLRRLASGKWVKIAGCVIVRQRPGTANGVVFVSLEDESGVANAVIMPDIFQKERMTIVGSAWLLIEGPIQNVDGVIHVRAQRIAALSLGSGEVASHDFR